MNISINDVIYYSGNKVETDHGNGIEQYRCDECTKSNTETPCEECDKYSNKKIEYNRKFIW